jgi:hypothetical protein
MSKLTRSERIEEMQAKIASLIDEGSVELFVEALVMHFNRRENTLISNLYDMLGREMEDIVLENLDGFQEEEIAEEFFNRLTPKQKIYFIENNCFEVPLISLMDMGLNDKQELLEYIESKFGYNTTKHILINADY